MSATRIELLASAAQNADGNSAAFTVSTLRQAMVGVDITAVSGTSPTLDLWLEGSDDGGTTWYELPARQVLKTSGAAVANTVQTDVRDIVDGESTISRHIAIYDVLPTDKVRVAWKLGGTTPEFTFSVSMVGK